MKDTDLLHTEQTVDLTNCDREPIHLLGRVQTFGCLLALRFDWIIASCSQNSQDYFNTHAEEMMGTPLKQWLDPHLLHDIRSAYQASSITGKNERLFSRIIERSDSPVDISVHHNGEFIIIELEMITADRSPEESFVRSLLSQFYRAENTAELIGATAQQIQLITGYDRVMIYRFLPSGSGEVVAEAKVPDIESFLGLHFPASDIPKQARALYKKNLLRVIYDVDGDTHAILPSSVAANTDIDLSFSTLRAVSPIHLEYLRNMGVSASLSVSLIVNGELWGLIACHHYSPKVPSYFMRTELELFAEIFALELSSRLTREQEAETNRLRDVHDHIMATMGSQGTLLDLLEMQFATMRKLIDCDGIAAVVDGEQRSQGRALPVERISDIQRYLNRQVSSKVLTCQCLADEIRSYDTGAYNVAGVLAIPISKSPRDYLLFYRSAESQTVNWAGNPEKPVELGPNGARLVPRSSFELWQQIHDDRCKEWSVQDKRSGESLRVTLLEVIIRHFQERNDIQRQASRKHEVLISELNHRVRNILNLVNAIVMQTEHDDRDVAEFIEVLTGRLMALSSAHDQLTASSWSTVSFRHLLDTEIKAYNAERGHVKLQGPDVSLKPEATTPIVLVIHELFTNAAKYGALSDSQQSGEVTIRWTADEQKGLVVQWRESGGPVVQPPVREGFGMTLIQSVIPHELVGSVDVQFLPSGVEAQLVIPARFLSQKEIRSINVQNNEDSTENHRLILPQTALIVEDSLVIALDLKKKLKNAGIDTVGVAGNTSNGRQYLLSRKPEVLISDIHLGSETAIPLVEQAVTSGIQCIIVSGYGDELQLPETLQHVTVLTKPVSHEALIQALSDLVGQTK